MSLSVSLVDRVILTPPTPTHSSPVDSPCFKTRLNSPQCGVVSPRRSGCHPVPAPVTQSHFKVKVPPWVSCHSCFGTALNLTHDGGVPVEGRLPQTVMCPSMGGSRHFHVLNGFLPCFQKWLSNRCVMGQIVSKSDKCISHKTFYSLLTAQLSNMKYIHMLCGDHPSISATFPPCWTARHTDGCVLPSYHPPQLPLDKHQLFFCLAEFDYPTYLI